MCKHVLNAQVSIRSPCCRKWFDCAECHAESENHPLLQSYEMVLHYFTHTSLDIPLERMCDLEVAADTKQIFICKKCRKAFRKNTEEFDESDEYCPNCDNHFVIDAVTPKMALKVEGEDARIDSRMLKDDRQKPQGQKSIFDVQDTADRLG